MEKCSILPEYYRSKIIESHTKKLNCTCGKGVEDRLEIKTPAEMVSKYRITVRLVYIMLLFPQENLKSPELEVG